MNSRLDPVRLVVNSAHQYSVRLARDTTEIRQAQALRFEVFNLELGEGLEQSYATALDEDVFDKVCDHLIVEHLPSAQVVGTYRLQSGSNAALSGGYYCAREFQFGVFANLRPKLIELGRACVHRSHRNLIVLGLLWKGIANYAEGRGAQFLVGCSSITSQDPAIGASAYSQLCRRYLVPPRFRTRPQPDFECPLDRLDAEPPMIPKLLLAYLSVGARICGPPALDREFKTIDFLTFLDLNEVPSSVWQRFFT